MPNQNITIHTESFDYTIGYNENESDETDTINIEAVHRKSFFMWTGKIDHESINNKTKTELVDLKPKLIFDMFVQYHNNNNMIDDSVKITFPSAYVSATEPILIEIMLIIKIYTKLMDKRIIVLVPKKNRSDDRTDKKIQQNYSIIDNEIKSMSSDFASKIDSVQKYVSEKFVVNRTGEFSFTLPIS